MSNQLSNRLAEVCIVGFGGALGVALRYVCIVSFTGAALWIVNVVGSFCLAYLHERLSGARTRLFVMTGMLGSFTTFSSVSYEAMELLQQSVIVGVLYGVTMTFCCIVAAFVGTAVAK